MPPSIAAAAEPECAFSKIDMPALSSTMKEGKVVSWLKTEGDPISAGEAIMVVESDKADMDVEAFEDGFLAAIITQEGETGAVGAPVALIAEDEGDIATLQAYAATLSGAPAPAADDDRLVQIQVLKEALHGVLVGKTGYSSSGLRLIRICSS